MGKDRFYMGLSFLTLSIKYLYLARNASDENAKRGNPHFILTNATEPDKYEEMTKWSDFNTSSPILFNFYHGLELLLKGFLILRSDYVFKITHSFEKLLEEFKKRYSGEGTIISILEKYLTLDLMPDFLATCLRNNNIQINNLYQFLRYPTDTKANNVYNYIDIKYKGREGLPFFRGLVSDLDTLGIKIVKLYREEEKKNNEDKQ